MERSLEQVTRSYERILRAIRSPNFSRQAKKNLEAKDEGQLAKVKSYLEQLGFNPDEALQVDLASSTPTVSFYQSGVDRSGERVGIRLTVTLERGE